MPKFLLVHTPAQYQNKCSFKCSCMIGFLFICIYIFLDPKAIYSIKKEQKPEDKKSNSRKAIITICNHL